MKRQVSMLACVLVTMGFVTGVSRANGGAPNNDYINPFVEALTEPNNYQECWDYDHSDQLDTDDINPFVVALTDPNAYLTMYGFFPPAPPLPPLGSTAMGDFVEVIRLEGSPVPEPAVLLLLALGGLELLKRKRKS